MATIPKPMQTNAGHTPMTDQSSTAAASSPSGDPYLLTPGPLTTSLTVKQAMLHDFGSRDATFIDLQTGLFL